MDKKTSLLEFINWYKTYEIWDYTFREPAIKKTQEIRDYLVQDKAELNEAIFYIQYLQGILEKWDKDMLEYEAKEMSLNQLSKFFFHVLENLWLNFSVAQAK